jgi:hypothetical protein
MLLDRSDDLSSSVWFPAWELNTLLSGAFEEPVARHAICVGRSMEVETDGVVWIIVILGDPEIISERLGNSRE